MRTRTISNYGCTVSESKNYLRVETSEDDPLIEALITASYEQVTAETNRDFTPTTYNMSIWSSSGDIFLSTQTVNSVSTGSLKEVDGSWYTYIDQTYNGPLTFTVAASGSVPSNVKVAQLLLINHWYEIRTPDVIGASATPLAFSVQALLSPYKLVRP
jgi:hypothetical protein